MLRTTHLLPLLLLGATASAQTTGPRAATVSAPLVVDSPFHRLADSGPEGFSTVAFDASAQQLFDELHEAGTLVRMRDFALPGSENVELLIRPFDVVEPGMRAKVIGENGVSELAPSVDLFTGSVPGRASRVFLGVSEDMVHGYLELEGDLFFLSSGLENEGVAYTTNARFFDGVNPLGNFCGVGNLEEEEDGTPELRADNVVRETEMFLELDHQYRALFPSNQAALDYGVLLTGASSEVFRRDLGATVTIPNGYIQVWNTTPPWGVISTFGNLSNFSSWWNSPQNPNGSLRRAVAHVLTSPIFGGVAQSIGITCSKTTSYAISSVGGSFPSPIQHQSGSNWDLFVLAHENGHIYGSQHTFDYSPPISCTDGSGPDSGTIMGYCHLDFGVAGVGMRFHPRVQDTIRTSLRGKSCPNVDDRIAGDYTGDGVVDAADLAEFDAISIQGFESRGAQDAFDLDGNGVLNAIDRDVLVALTAGPVGPATSLLRNGSGSNCAFCFVPVTQPIIGQTWTTYVGSYLGVIPTTITGSTTPIAGVNTKFGELLIGVGAGQVLFTDQVTSNGQWSTHAIDIPFDGSFLGLTIYTQAAMWKPTGIELVTAMDITIGLE